jgi:hypothetical protein
MTDKSGSIEGRGGSEISPAPSERRVLTRDERPLDRPVPAPRPVEEEDDEPVRPEMPDGAEPVAREGVEGVETAVERVKRTEGVEGRSECPAGA